MHPLDVQTLLLVFRRLIESKATVIVYVIDMGPGGGVRSGQIVAVGISEDIGKNPESQTGEYLNAILRVR